MSREHCRRFAPHWRAPSSSSTTTGLPAWAQKDRSLLSQPRSLSLRRARSRAYSFASLQPLPMPRKKSRVPWPMAAARPPPKSSPRTRSFSGIKDADGRLKRYCFNLAQVAGVVTGRGAGSRLSIGSNCQRTRLARRMKNSSTTAKEPTKLRYRKTAREKA